MIRRRARVEGIVQGVGFRPHVHRLAHDLGLTGHVANDGRGVVIEVQGPAAACGAFADRLVTDAPFAADVTAVRWGTLDPVAEARFAIRPSAIRGDRQVGISPDLATCEDCLRELWDPSDRRHRYPFVNCTNCGPRYTIVTDVPYDRCRTTMAGFTMCAACATEYADPDDRRFHAQPVCCPACGPRLRLMGPGGCELAGDPVTTTAELLASGAVVAVKGLGGHHLAVAADDEEAVRRLRARKQRDEKPFAVMVADLEAASRLAEVGPAEAALLTDPARAIVLLRRRDDADLAEAVAPGHRTVGLVLPYTPLHHLLAAAHPAPFVLTSANPAGEPMIVDDDEATTRLAGIADAWLTHERPIHARADDSVARVVADRPLLLRRGRGHAPRPVRLPVPASRALLGCGAELKHTVCLARGDEAVVSPHLGDLEDWATFQAFTEGVDHLAALLGVEPVVVAHDLHPEYRSSRWARSLAGVELVGVAHHHAHVAACLADNGRADPVIGVAFDGLGYGTDGTLWGGEFLVADLAGFERVGHLAPVPLPGGEAAIREPWRMAAAHLDAVLGDRVPDDLAVRRRHADQWPTVVAAARAGVNAPVTTSVGRLFDAVAAVAGVRDVIGHEGQAAMLLEQTVDLDLNAGDDRCAIDDDGSSPFLAHGGELVAAAARAVQDGEPVSAVATRFHRSVARLVVEGCVIARDRRGVGTVALSGGVFQNAVLVGLVLPALHVAGFEVLTHRRVPPNDGGISLGQVAVAAARHRRGC